MDQSPENKKNFKYKILLSLSNTLKKMSWRPSTCTYIIFEWKCAGK